MVLNACLEEGFVEGEHPVEDLFVDGVHVLVVVQSVLDVGHVGRPHFARVVPGDAEVGRNGGVVEGQGPPVDAAQSVHHLGQPTQA